MENQSGCGIYPTNFTQEWEDIDQSYWELHLFENWKEADVEI